jgi:DNA repair exonuclease SbcCD nuclease subunit
VEARQIAASAYDYIALGHHHALLNVSAGSTAAYYSGAPIPIAKGSQGTFLMVDLEEGKPAAVTIHKL